MAGRNTEHRGDETESKVIHEIIAAGHSVSVPFGDNDKYGVIIDNDKQLYRIQCKTAWKNKAETIRFNTHSQTTTGRNYHEETYEDWTDAFVVRYPETETLYWVDIDEATIEKMELRFEADLNHPSINWADDYKSRGDIPPDN